MTEKINEITIIRRDMFYPKLDGETLGKIEKICESHGLKKEVQHTSNNWGSHSMVAPGVPGGAILDDTLLEIYRSTSGTYGEPEVRIRRYIKGYKGIIRAKPIFKGDFGAFYLPERMADEIWKTIPEEIQPYFEEIKCLTN